MIVFKKLLGTWGRRCAATHWRATAAGAACGSCRDEGGWFRMTLMAVTAGDDFVVRADLSEIFGIDIGGHGDHDARDVLVGVGIGGLGSRVGRVAELAADAELLSEAAHGHVEVHAGDVLGKNLEVGGRRGGRALALRSGWRRVLGEAVGNGIGKAKH
jgi:hypothetical protein